MVLSSVVQGAEDTFVRLLSTQGTSSLRKSYAERCIANVKAGTSSFQSLRVLRRIIDLVPRTASRADLMTQSVMVQGLEEREHLLGLFFRGLQTYHEQAVAALVPADGGAVAPNADDVVVADGVGHLLQINTRFDFLYFILRCSSLSVTRDQAFVLWDCLVARAITPAVEKATLRWLGQACNSQSAGFSMLADGVAEELFMSRMIAGSHPCPVNKVGCSRVPRWKAWPSDSLSRAVGDVRAALIACARTSCLSMRRAAG